MIRALLLMMLALGCSAEDAAYDAWAGGRPVEALPALHAAAEREGAWHRWLDLGLAAAAAERRGAAVAWLLEARRRAPARPEPRAALAALGAAAPSGWCERLGPLAAPGTGPLAPVLALLAGAALAWSVVGRRRRGIAAGAAASLLLLIGPGALAAWRDAREPLAATVAATQLLAADGRPLRALAEGTVVRRDGATAPWGGRVLVRLPDGTAGWIPAEDLEPRP